MQSIRKWSITKRASLLLKSVCDGFRIVAVLIVGLFTIFSFVATAQEQGGKIERSTPPTAATEKPLEKKSEDQATTPAKTTEVAKSNDSAKPKAAAKRVDTAIINLQTTVTGNQEQPRVMYILPWQSPAPEDVDFESLENQTKSVFGHIERDELRRELESSEKKTK